MEIKKSLFIKAFIITVAIFVSVFSLNLYINSERERVVTDRMNELSEDFEDFQALSALTEVYGENATCIAQNSRIRLLDTKIWKLGAQIETYRKLTKDYWDDPYYQQLKRKFNREEVTYLAILEDLERRCGLNQTEILFFYRKTEECPTCDEQSYVLDYFNKRIDDEIAIFSFDSDLGVPAVDVLLTVYNITEYPCVVVDETAYCGLRGGDQMQEILCNSTNELSICAA